MVFPLHASEILRNLRREEKCIFQSSRIVTFLPVQNFFVPGAKMWRFSGRMWQKTSEVKKKYFRVQERHILPRNVTNVKRYIFCHRQMWRHPLKSETGSWEEIRLGPTRIAVPWARRFQASLLLNLHLSVCVSAVLGELAVWIQNQC